MRAAFLLVVAHAAALAALCAAGGLEHAEVLLSSETEECECCAAKVADLKSHLAEHITKVADLQSHLAEHIAENIALRKVKERLESDLDECHDESAKQPLVWRLTAEYRPEEPSTATTEPLPQVPAPRRKTLATPAPTPFTPIPTTATPSATPSASPVPTTTAITTYSQLENAVVDTTNSEVVIAAPFAFPSQAPILIGADRSVSIVGTSAVDGGRVTLDGAGRSRLFFVTDGSLSLSFLDFVNATAPGPNGGSCTSTGFEICAGGTILVIDGTLTISSCLIRGGGPGESKTVRVAWMGGGVAVVGPGVNAEFNDAKFQNLRANYGTAFSGFYCTEDAPCVATFRHCRFEGNTALKTGVVLIAWEFVSGYVYDTTIARNDGCALMYQSHSSGAIERCHFVENTGSTNTWPALGGAGLIVGPGGEVNLRDCLFERNVGADGYIGGAASVSGNPSSTWRNVSFIENGGYNGAALGVTALSSVTMIDCSARSDYASAEGGNLFVENSEIRIINSTFADTISNGYSTFAFRDGSILVPYTTRPSVTR